MCMRPAAGAAGPDGSTVTTWQDALDELVRTRGRALVGYAYLLTGDSREAEDLVQDALVRTFTRGRGTREVASAEAYVRRTILTTYVDGFRRRKRWASIRHLTAVPEPTPPDGPHAGPEPVVTTRVAVQQALALLPPRERACIVLRHFEDMTVAQVADALSLSVGTVKRYLSDATRTLEQHLGDLAGADDEPAHVTDEVLVTVRRAR
ncbi:RNA polymerase, sigma-24 subunit, ECF subfamily [Cellulomonas flavigena DSM 20109]|uniref:RNA polymerase, sigma-24 subunit, ECF subfamily n=2 Tax=Cellulomonas flavigena TaxID=1711 RepID=D5UJL0_CELFN|nr:RNA polymerase, sigma-24 subunit, ECF subfamily [Cellulomonas flavigena DSM 20109]